MNTHIILHNTQPSYHPLQPQGCLHSKCNILNLNSFPTNCSSKQCENIFKNQLFGVEHSLHSLQYKLSIDFPLWVDRLYINPDDIVPFKYPNTHFKVSKWTRPRSAMNLLTTLTTCARFGVSHIILYMMVLTSLEHGIVFIFSFLSQN